NERGTILMPGVFGAANWTGAAWDPETEMYYVTAIREPIAIRLQRLSRDGRDIYIGRLEFVTGPQGLSLFKPALGQRGSDRHDDRRTSLARAGRDRRAGAPGDP